VVLASIIAVALLAAECWIRIEFVQNNTQNPTFFNATSLRMYSCARTCALALSILLWMSTVYGHDVCTNSDPRLASMHRAFVHSDTLSKSKPWGTKVLVLVDYALDQ
jgi:hypothetical protein